MHEAAPPFLQIPWQLGAYFNIWTSIPWSCNKSEDGNDDDNNNDDDDNENDNENNDDDNDDHHDDDDNTYDDSDFFFKIMLMLLTNTALHISSVVGQKVCGQLYFWWVIIMAWSVYCWQITNDGF